MRAFKDVFAAAFSRLFVFGTSPLPLPSTHSSVSYWEDGRGSGWHGLRFYAK